MRSLALLVALVAGCLALGMPAPVLADALPTTIYAIQQGLIPQHTDVFVDSVIVTAVDLKPSTYGFEVQERAGGQYSGALVYTSYSRPDTIGGVGIQPGDLVSVRAQYNEYPTSPPSHGELDKPTSPPAFAPEVHIIRKSYGMPPAAHVRIEALGYGANFAAQAEKWEGVFIAVDTVRCSAHWPFNEWDVVQVHPDSGAGLNDSLRINDKLVIPTISEPDTGTVIARMQGVFTAEFGTYRLWPRGNFDIYYLGAPPAPNLVLAYAISNSRIVAVFDQVVTTATAGNASNFSLLTTDVVSSSRDPLDSTKVNVDYTPVPAGTADQLTACSIQNQSGVPMPDCESKALRLGVVPISFIQTPGHADTTQVFGEQVTTSGICTGSSDQFGGFYLGTRGGGPYNGIYVFDSSHHVAIADTVVVSATANEYYGKTELYLPEYVVNAPSGGGPLQPNKLDISVLMTPSPRDTAEYWEDCLVEVDSVRVATQSDSLGRWNISRRGDSVRVGDAGAYHYTPSVGDSMSITGIVDFTQNVWTLQPRTDGDIRVYYSLHTGIARQDFGMRVATLTNSPNPFNPLTAIEFGITSPVEVRLEIYDATGRLVRTLMSGKTLQSGAYRVEWNGNDSQGRPTASGIYYARLRAGDRLETHKLVLAK